jgi:hypothetical protein
MLDVSLRILDRAQLPSQDNHLFDPPLESIQIVPVAPLTRLRVVLPLVTAERVQEYLEAVMNEVARSAGSVLSPSFRNTTQPLVRDALTRLHGI